MERTDFALITALILALIVLRFLGPVLNKAFRTPALDEAQKCTTQEQVLADIAALAVFEAITSITSIMLSISKAEHETFKAKLASAPETFNSDLIANLEALTDDGNLVETLEALAAEIAPALVAEIAPATAEIAPALAEIAPAFAKTLDDDPLVFALAEYAFMFALAADLDGDLEAEFETRKAEFETRKAEYEARKAKYATQFNPKYEVELLEIITKLKAVAPSLIATLVTTQKRALAGLAEAPEQNLGRIAALAALAAFEALAATHGAGLEADLEALKAALASAPETFDGDLIENLEALANDGDLVETLEALAAEIAPGLAVSALAFALSTKYAPDFVFAHAAEIAPDLDEVLDDSPFVLALAEYALIFALKADLDGDLGARKADFTTQFRPKYEVELLKAISKLKAISSTLIDALVAIQKRALAGLTEARKASGAE